MMLGLIFHRWLNLSHVFLFCILSGFVFGSDLLSEEIISATKFNEKCVSDYECLTEYKMVQYVEWEDGKFKDVLAEPHVTRTKECHFIVDKRIGAFIADEKTFDRVLNGDIYYTHAREKKYNNVYQILYHDSEGAPVKGVIPVSEDNRFNNMTIDPFVIRSCIYIQSSGVENGAIKLPIYHIISKADELWYDNVEHLVEGYSCLKGACLYPDPSSDGSLQLLVYFWLAESLNYSLVKQQTYFIPSQSDPLYKEMREAWPDNRTFYETLEKRVPTTLYVAKKYKRFDDSIWVPMVINSFPTRDAYDSRFADLNNKERIITETISKSEHTRNFAQCILAGVNICKVDDSSVSINKGYPETLFSKNLFVDLPDLPVYDFVMEVFPNDKAGALLIGENVNLHDDLSSSPQNLQGYPVTGSREKITDQQDYLSNPDLLSPRSSVISDSFWLRFGVFIILIIIPSFWFALKRIRKNVQ